MRTIWAAVSDNGKVRDHNEDAWLADDKRCLYAVADGMGGAAAGEVASQLAIETLRREAGASDCEIRPMASALVHAFVVAHRSILADAQQHEERRGMGTTMTALFHNGSDVAVAHVGDSRCYLVRLGSGRQVTKDHTMHGAQPGVDVSGWNHVLLNCLGGRPESHSHTDVARESLLPGDVWVLCSDGLADYVDAEEVARLAGAIRSASGFTPDRLPHDLAAVLVKRALNLGGADNITVLVLVALGS